MIPPALPDEPLPPAPTELGQTWEEAAEAAADSTASTDTHPTPAQPAHTPQEA